MGATMLAHLLDRAHEDAKGVAQHDDDPDYPRPEGFASVEWHGTVEPLNAEDHDTWIDTNG